MIAGLVLAATAVLIVGCLPGPGHDGPRGTGTTEAWRLHLDPATGFTVAGVTGSEDRSGGSPDTSVRLLLAGDPETLAPPFVSITASPMASASFDDPRATPRIDGRAVRVTQPSADHVGLGYETTAGPHPGIPDRDVAATAFEVHAWGVPTDQLVAALQGARVHDGRLETPNMPSTLRPITLDTEALDAYAVYEPTDPSAEGRNPEDHNPERLTLRVSQDRHDAWTDLASGAVLAPGPVVPGRPADLRGVTPLPGGSVEVHLVWMSTAPTRSVVITGHLSSADRLDVVLAGLRDLDDAGWEALPHRCIACFG